MRTRMSSTTLLMAVALGQRFLDEDLIPERFDRELIEHYQEVIVHSEQFKSAIIADVVKHGHHEFMEMTAAIEALTGTEYLDVSYTEQDWWSKL